MTNFDISPCRRQILKMTPPSRWRQENLNTRWILPIWRAAYAWSFHTGSSCHLWKNSKRPNKGLSNCFHFFSVSDVFMRSSSLIQALLLWRCLQWSNARLYSVLFDVAPCYWKSLCKIPCAQNSWRYESIVLTNRIAEKRMNIKKIKLFCCKTKLK